MTLLIPETHLIAISLTLFLIGIMGILARRSLLFILIGIEIMLNGVALLLVGAGAKWAQADGQIMMLFLLVMAGVEVAIGLTLFLQIHRNHPDLNSDELRELKG